MFERPHHQRIARILESLDAGVLRQHGCWFGGGTAIALRLGEFRESADIDFLVSDADGYRALRQRLRGATGLGPLLRADAAPLPFTREMRIDQYGMRAFVDIGPVPVKFEIVNEGRIAFEPPAPNDVVCGVATLSLADLAASKLLANADRWRDDSVFSRDAIDLAFMDLPPRRLAPAFRKAMDAYGADVATDLERALGALRGREGWLARCVAALSIREPSAAVVQRLRALGRRLRLASLGIVDTGE